MNWQPPSFERHQFAGRRAKVVSAVYRPDGWDTTGISFGDLQVSMHVMRRERVQERRLPTPPWVNNNEALREEVLKACEKRIYLTTRNVHLVGGTHQERYATIKQHERMRLKRWLEILRKLRARYKTEPEATKPGLEIQIQNVDTFCCMLKRGSVEVTIAVVHFYYRLGWNSVAVAQELNLKPPHVRQILARLLHSASGIPQASSQPKWVAPPRSGPDFDLMMKWHSEGMPLDELTLRLRLLGYDPLKISSVHRALENAKETHFQKLVEQVAEAEGVFARVRRVVVQAKRSASIKASWSDPAKRAARVNPMTTYWANPEVRRARGAIMKEVQNRPGVNAKRSASQKGAWKKPGARKRRSLINKEVQNRPEVKAAHKQRATAQWAKRRKVA
jgi:hypothetical protein